MMDTLLLFHKWENYFKYYRKKQDCTFGCYWTWKMNYDCHIHVQDFSNYQSSSTSFHHPFHHPFSLPHLSMYVKGKMKLYTTSVHSAMVVSNSASLQISPQQWSLNLMLIPHKRILKTIYIYSTLFITFKILISISNFSLAAEIKRMKFLAYCKY